MSRKLSRWAVILAAGAALTALASMALAIDPGINQPGVRGGTAGVGAPGAGAWDPGINQPGAMGNVGRDPGFNQPGVAGNVRGVSRRSVRR